jgi:hypothetical protein
MPLLVARWSVKLALEVGVTVPALVVGVVWVIVPALTVKV